MQLVDHASSQYVNGMSHHIICQSITSDTPTLPINVTHDGFFFQPFINVCGQVLLLTYVRTYQVLYDGLLVEVMS